MKMNIRIEIIITSYHVKVNVLVLSLVLGYMGIKKKGEKHFFCKMSSNKAFSYYQFYDKI